MVTEWLSQTQFRALNIPHNEADLIAQDYDALESQFHGLLVIDLQRILEGFLRALFAEIARRDPRVLMSNRTVTFEDVLKTDNMVELPPSMVCRNQLPDTYMQRIVQQRRYAPLLPGRCCGALGRLSRFSVSSKGT
jgi:hypothetical protein